VFLAGDDALLRPFLLAGGQGVVSVVANVLPTILQDLCEAILLDQLMRIEPLEAVFLPVAQALTEVGNPVGIKFLLAKLGRSENVLRLPLLAEKSHAKLEGVMNIIEGAAHV
jgi:4-hydroxy-tetrahydrodipicolinate synthase